MSIRLGQALSSEHFRLYLSRALASITSFLMITARTSLAGFPARISASYLAFRTGLHLEATSAGM